MLPGKTMSFLPRRVCRLCLWQAYPLTSLFASTIGLKASEKMNLMFPFSVYVGDGLPGEICDGCAYKLDMLHEFYMSVLTSHSKLVPGFVPDSEEALARRRRCIIEALKTEPRYSIFTTPSSSNATNHYEMYPTQSDENVVEEEVPQQDVAVYNVEDENEEPPASGQPDDQPPAQQIRPASGQPEDQPPAQQIGPASSQPEDQPPAQQIRSASSLPNAEPPARRTRSRSVSELDVVRPTPVTRSRSVGETAARCRPAERSAIQRPPLETRSDEPAATTTQRRARGTTLTPSREVKEFPCSRCSVKFKTKVEMELHYCNSITSSGKQLSCRYCFRQFRDPASLAVHRKNHTDQFSVKCEKCRKMFPTAKALKVHVNTVCRRKRSVASSSSDLKCDLCSKYFSSVVGMRLHYVCKEHRSKKSKLIREQKLKGEARKEASKEPVSEQPVASESGSGPSNAKVGNEPSIEDVEMRDVSTNRDDSDEDERDHDDSDYRPQMNIKRLRRRTYSDSVWLIG